MGLFKCMKSGRRSRDASPARKPGSKTHSPSPTHSAAYGSSRASPGAGIGSSPAAKSSASFSGAVLSGGASGYPFPPTSSAAALLLAPGPPLNGGRGAKHARDVQLLDYRGTGLLELPGEVFASERTLLHLYADNNRLVELPRVRCDSRLLVLYLSTVLCVLLFGGGESGPEDSISEVEPTTEDTECKGAA